MDPAVVELMTKLQCAESEAQAALAATRGQTEEAVRLLRRSVFAIKGRFKSDLRKVYGIFIVFINAETETVLRSHVVLSKEGWIYNIDLNQGVMELEDYIYHTEFRIETIPTLTKDLNDHFKEKLRFDLLKAILAAIVAEKPGEIVEMLRVMIASQLADRELDIVIKTEKISRVRFEKLEKNQPKEAPAAAAPAEGEAPAEGAGAGPGGAEGEAKEKVLILKTDVVLAPTNGTRVVDLKLGDKIYLKIIDNSPQGRYIANLLKGDSPTPVPVLVPIEELTHTDSGRCSIITKFGPGVFGRAVVSEGLMIKVEGTGERENEPAPLPSDNLLPLVLGGGLLLLVLLFIIYFFVFRKL